MKKTCALGVLLIVGATAAVDMQRTTGSVEAGHTTAGVEAGRASGP